MHFLYLFPFQKGFSKYILSPNVHFSTYFITKNVTVTFRELFDRMDSCVLTHMLTTAL